MSFRLFSGIAARNIAQSPWLGFVAFCLGQLSMWKAAPYVWDRMVVAGLSTHEIVQDIVHGFDVASFFGNPLWGVPFGLIWFVPMYAVAGTRSLLMAFLFGAFVQVYLFLVFLRAGDYFSFLSTFRYLGTGVELDIIPALAKLFLGIAGLFAGPVILALLVRAFSRTP